MMPTPIVISRNISRKWAYWSVAGIWAMSRVPQIGDAEDRALGSPEEERGREDGPAARPSPGSGRRRAPSRCTPRRAGTRSAWPIPPPGERLRREPPGERQDRHRPEHLGRPRDRAGPCRNRRTPRSRKKTWASRARTRASRAGRLGATNGGEHQPPERARPMRKNPQEAIQSRNAGRRNLR